MHLAALAKLEAAERPGGPRFLAVFARLRDVDEGRGEFRRAFNERAAINAPIQGSAADIIRRAMVRMDAALEAEKLSGQMLLQVHDELVFEVRDEEAAATIALARRVMIDAPLPALQLSVPLQVDARAARNWDEAH